MLSPEKLVGLLAEPARRRVIAALILSAGDLDDLITRTGLSARDVVDSLDRLTAAGLVEHGSDGTVVLLEELFKVAARSQGAASRPATSTESGEGSKKHRPNRQVDQNGASTEERILAKSFVDGRLVHLPRKRSKRLVVLNRLAQEFEPGRHYSERQVNRILAAFDPDVAALRRHLVDERFLDRADGNYWRSGGSVDT